MLFNTVQQVHRHSNKPVPVRGEPTVPPKAMLDEEDKDRSEESHAQSCCVHLLVVYCVMDAERGGMARGAKEALT